MLSRDLLPLERAVYRAAREQLSSDNQAEKAGIDAEQRDRAAAAVVGPIIDDPALYPLMPERHSDAQGRIYDEAYQDVLRAAINDLYYFGPLEDLLYDESLSEIMVNAPDDVRVEVGGKTKFACVDGPDFDATQVDWNDLRARQGSYRTEEGQAMEAYKEESCACHR